MNDTASPTIPHTAAGPMAVPVTGGPDVHAALVEARSRHWYALSPWGGPVLLRFRDCEQAMRDPRLRGGIGTDLLGLSGITEGPLAEWQSLIMFGNDGETHRRLRSLVAMAFTSRRLDAARPVVAAEATRRTDRDGEVDVVADLSHWMPIHAVASMLGIPDEDIPMVGRWSQRLGAVFSAFITPEARAQLEDTLGSFGDYVVAMLADRRAHPRDDLTTHLIEARDGEDRLSEPELVAMILNLVIGGHDATERLIANGMWLLLRHPDQWRLLTEHPGGSAPVVEEVLRYEPSTSGTARIATEDIDWGELHIPAGSLLATSTLAANRDPEVFERPQEFDVTRTGARSLTFGGGPHLCLGAALARVVTQESLAAMARHWPGAELIDEDPPWSAPEDGFRGITRLRVETGART